MRRLQSALGERLIEALTQLYRPDPVTDEERAEHARLIHEQKWREQKAADSDLFTADGQ